MPASDAVKPEYKDYKNYCEEQLGVDSTGLNVADLPYPFGRGILTSRKIAKGSAILRVPLSSLLTHKACLEAEAKPFFDKIGSKIAEAASEQEDVVLALLLLLHRDVIKGASRWHKHIQLLPQSYDLPWSWTDEERDALNGAGLHAIAVAMLAQLRADFSLLQPVVQAATGGALNMRLEDWDWAMSSVWSRGVSLRLTKGKKGEIVKAIAPFFDMFNHHPDVQMRHAFDVDRGCLTVVSDEAYEPGQQVFLNYGLHCSREMIKLRGFCTPQNSAEWFELQLTIAPKGKVDSEGNVTQEIDTEDFNTRRELIAIQPPVLDLKQPTEDGLARVQLTPDDLPMGFQGFFNLHAQVRHNAALYRFVRVTLAARGEELKALKSQMEKDPNAGATLDLEAKLIDALSTGLMEVAENLQPAPTESMYVQAFQLDWDAGTKAMAQLTAAIQKEMGYTPSPAAASAKHATQAKDEEEELSIKAKPGKGKQGAAGKGKASAAQAEVAAEPAPEVSAEPITYSPAATDVHLRRMQMVHYYRIVERACVTAHLKGLEEHSNIIRQMSEEHNAQVEAVKAAETLS